MAVETFAASGNVFTSLGIDGQMLLFQGIAFLILVWALGKFVFPVLIKAVDDRQATIEASTKAADEARVKAEAAEAEVAKLLAQARREAKDIVATAKTEATAAVQAAEDKAVSRAKKIVAGAQDQIEKDTIAAKKALHNETIELVASATEKILGNTVDSKVDQKVVARAVEEAR